MKKLDPRLVAAVRGGLLLLVLVSAVLRWGAGTGFTTKTLWDRMDLLLIPAVRALGAYVLQASQSARQQEREDQRVKTDRAIAADAQREQALQQYLDAMTALMVDQQLRSSNDDETRTVARTRTLTVLRRLDRECKGAVLQFLHEAALIQFDSVLDLRDADLSGADLSGARLSRAYLTEAADLGERPGASRVGGGT